MRDPQQSDWFSPLDADRYERRARQISEAGEFGAIFTHEDETHSYAALAPVALQANEQLELDLPGYDLRDAIRKALAEKIEHEVLPLTKSEYTWLEKYPERLRVARQSAQWGIRLKDGKLVAYWDQKAGLSRLCPDDAREEAMRLRRRILPAREALRESGHRFGMFFFTMPNFARGKLQRGMRQICKLFRERIIKAKDAHGEPLFPAIKGAIVVLEAPLGRERDWNVHLNVILCVKGYLDFADLRQQWGWNVECPKRWISDAPGAFEGAFAELIKYAVAATVSKSAEHAASGKSPAPPMLEWTGDELLEWLRAMRGFRRTRTYGVLYGLKDPEREDIGPVVMLGTISRHGGRYVRRCTLLDSIPEDKYPGLTPKQKIVAFLKSLAPGGLAGAGSMGESIPRLNEVMA